MDPNGFFLGINAEPMDPSAAIVRNGRLIAMAEEERFLRLKHAAGHYPLEALKFCLRRADITIDQVEAVAVAWDVEGYSSGRIESFFKALGNEWPIDPSTLAWQQRMISTHRPEAIIRAHQSQWARSFGRVRFPPILGIPHHYAHAFQAFGESGFPSALTVTLDGSGDEHCTVVWRCERELLEPIRQIRMPHSLGWVYAAITEYLGFEAYDGEYKTMGLAALGSPSDDLAKRMAHVIFPAEDGIEYRVDPSFIHFGPHSYSGRFTDHLVTLLGRAPRLPGDPITEWHRDLAYALQSALEAAVSRLVEWGVQATGLHRVCIGGGVAHNVKLNGHLLHLPQIQDLFAHPLCGDSGSAAAAALAVCHLAGGPSPERLTSVALGPDIEEEDIGVILREAKIPFTCPPNLLQVTVEDLAAGRVVAWVQGRMESGPRALGHRSILADPRCATMRDRVNAIVKLREDWRPFCPALPAESFSFFFGREANAQFMTLALPASEDLRQMAPATVHIDGSARAQAVHADDEPLFHELLTRFAEKTGVPVLLNTSLNVRGEPMVCSVRDALRTFWSTGLDTLVIGDFVVRKPSVG